MKDDESPSRDTRLDPLDVVPDATVPGGVLLPPDTTEVLAHAPSAPMRPGRPAPPAPRGVKPPSFVPAQPAGANATQPLGAAVLPNVFRPRPGPMTVPMPPPPRSSSPESTERRGSPLVIDRPGDSGPRPFTGSGGTGTFGQQQGVFDTGPLSSPPSGAGVFSDATVAERPAVSRTPILDAEPEDPNDQTAVGFNPLVEGDSTLGLPGPAVAMPAPAPSNTGHRPRLPTEPLIGSNAKDVVFLPTEPNTGAPDDPIPRPSEMPRSQESGGVGAYARLPRLTSGWPFLPIAPMLVVIIGLVVAFAIGLVGLDQLSRAGEEHAGARAELLAVTVAARLGALPPERRLEAAQLAARRSASELLVVSTSNEVVYDATLGIPDPASLTRMLKTGKGAMEMQRIGRARYSVKPITGGEQLLVLVPEPRITEGANALVSALAALTVLLLGVAAGVAYAVSRDVTRDVDFVTDRVRTMAQIRTEPTGELIPARTIDEIGILTATFNKLVARFGRASQQYRTDLARASVADRERAAFLAAVSHELRSPLNAILGFADILMEEVDGPLSPTAKEEVDQIRGSGQHLLGLINDILEFSALESGQLRLARSRVDVLALANEVLRESRGLVGDRPLAVRIEGESLVARVDGRRVRQILGNLVNNAIKFTQQGEVVVRVHRNGTFAYLSVTDTGPGISEADRALIFEEFQQARTERGRRRGTGLGLAITRRLVALHGGTIGVKSELGRGSTFEVNLPIGNVDAPPSRKAVHPNSTPPLSMPPPSGPGGRP